MTEDFKEVLDWAGGFISNQAAIGENSRFKDCLIPGSKNVWIEGRSRFRSWDGLAFFNNFGNSVTHIVGGMLGTLKRGSVIQFLDRLYWAIGDGNVSVGNGSTVTALGSLGGARTNILHYYATQVLTGSLGMPISGLFQAGISKPVSPPVISAHTSKTVNGIAGRLSGLVSIRVSYVSSITGTEGNASDPSNTVAFDGDYVQILLPPTPPDARQAGGVPKVRIYSTVRGFGAFGPWFYVGQSEFNQESPHITTWSDGDLLRILAPIDHDPPRQATHCFSLGDVMILAGAGGRLQASLPGFPEAYPPDFETNLDPQEDVLAIRGRPEDGWQYVCCRNSIHTVSLNLDDEAPITARAIFGQVGIANPNAACQVSGQLYFYSGGKNASRTSGSRDPDSSFALAVEDQMQDWDPNKVVVGYHQIEDCVCYFHETTCLIYKRKLDQWCAPFILDNLAGNSSGAEVSSCETIDGRLIFSVGTSDGGQLQYALSGGSNPNLPWKAIPAWREGQGGQGYDKTITHFIFSYDIGSGKQIECLLRGDFDLSTVRATSGLLSGSALPVYAKWVQCNINNIKVFTLEFQGTGGNQLVQDCLVLGGVCTLRV